MLMGQMLGKGVLILRAVGAETATYKALGGGGISDVSDSMSLKIGTKVSGVIAFRAIVSLGLRIMGVR